LELLTRADESVFLLLYGWVGRFPALDAIARLTVSDYLVPVVLSLILLGLWFAGRTSALRERNQRGVMTALLGLALANLTVEAFNQVLFRPRPFSELEVSLLFYQPTDSSFPANPAALGFTIATGVWLWNRKAGSAMLVMAAAYSIARVYAGVFYPLDVIGGAAIGTLVSLVAALVLRLAEPVPSRALRFARSLYLA
jgi:undecaprenyl-diphosphatase